LVGSTGATAALFPPAPAGAADRPGNEELGVGPAAVKAGAAQEAAAAAAATSSVRRLNRRSSVRTGTV